MKKIYLLVFSLIISISTHAQLVLTQSSTNGIVDVSYGASGDYSLYDPNGNVVVLYIWIDQVMNSGNIYYEDQWEWPMSLISLTFDGTAHTGSINFNTHTWDGGTVIPVGTVLTNFNILLRNAAGDSQSADIVATDYGYVASTLPVEEFETTTTAVFSIDNRIHIKGLNKGEFYSLSIYDTLGRLVKKLNSDASIIEASELKSAVYFLVLETNEGNVFKNKIIIK